ncbi:plasmid mobilization protein MobA [Escherichia coli]|uniref:plasmid mobilization protein MobA n=1 Tax=Escherichia coli TaxID=562 RepID=UPI000C1B93F4|nr:plasmid mobilization protein MobA [Escherichia coli]
MIWQPEFTDKILSRKPGAVQTVSGFLRAAALGKKVNSLTDDRVLKEVMRLGALQKKLFIDGKRVGDREYAEVLIAITEYHRALLSRLMAD